MGLERIAETSIEVKFPKRLEENELEGLFNYLLKNGYEIGYTKNVAGRTFENLENGGKKVVESLLALDGNIRKRIVGGENYANFFLIPVDESGRLNLGTFHGINENGDALYCGENETKTNFFDVIHIMKVLNPAEIQDGDIVLPEEEIHNVVGLINTYFSE